MNRIIAARSSSVLQQRAAAAAATRRCYSFKTPATRGTAASTPSPQGMDLPYCRSISSGTGGTTTGGGRGTTSSNNNNGNGNGNITGISGNANNTVSGPAAGVMEGNPAASASVRGIANAAAASGGGYERIVVGTLSAAKAAAQANESSSSSSSPVRDVYVHPLSRMVLEYLQEECHRWVEESGLNRSLTLRRDGGFELMNYDSVDTGAAPGDGERGDTRIWTSFDERDGKHWLTAERKESNYCRRFLLQDNALTPWSYGGGGSYAGSSSYCGSPSTEYCVGILPVRVHATVENMIRAVDRLE